MVKINSAVELASKLEEAIILGKKKGLDTSAWERKLGLLEQAREVAERTYELLNTQGWCLWQCHTLNDEVIVVVRDELISGFPRGYPVCMEQELECLLEVENSTLRLIHETKKLAAATVIGTEKRKRGGGAG